jgi:hypothetical protein
LKTVAGDQEVADQEVADQEVRAEMAINTRKCYHR